MKSQPRIELGIKIKDIEMVGSVMIMNDSVNYSIQRKESESG